MNQKEIEMHLAAGKAAGEERTCGVKLRYGTVEGAQRHADSLNRRKEAATGERHRTEPYPCVWCSPGGGTYYYHVGREMTQGERKQYAAE